MQQDSCAPIFPDRDPLEKTFAIRPPHHVHAPHIPRTDTNLLELVADPPFFPLRGFVASCDPKNVSNLRLRLKLSVFASLRDPNQSHAKTPRREEDNPCFLRP